MLPGQAQHVIQRGNNREAIFNTVADYRSAQCGFAIHEVNQAIFTQINRQTIQEVCEALGLSPTRARAIMDK